MPNQRTSALLVARPGDLRDCMEALLSATAQIGPVNKLDEISETCGTPLESQAGLVLLALVPGASEPESGLTVGRARARFPRARCIFLANDVQQQKEAETAGADAVLLTGVPAARLVATVLRLLPLSGEPEEVDDALVSVEPRSARTRRPCRL